MQTREDYLEKLSAQMVEWDNQIDQLKDKAKSAPGSDHHQAIADLQSKRDRAAQKLQALSIAGDHEWEELKQGTETIWGEVASDLKAAILKVK